jgi:ABC-type multidrug transport system fused ATPase/permease subunit
VEIDPGRLSRVFAVPAWLSDLGLMSWLAVGAVLLLVGVVWLLSLTATIVIPVITASIMAAVLSPLVGWLAQHRLGRGGAAALVLLLVIAAGVLIVVLLLSGVASQAPELKKSLQSAVDKIEGALEDAGVSQSTAQSAGDNASSSVSDAFHALLEGVDTGIAALASLAAAARRSRAARPGHGVRRRHGRIHRARRLPRPRSERHRRATPESAVLMSRTRYPQIAFFSRGLGH